MRNKLTIVQCASTGCSRTFATRSNNPVQYCPDCRIARIRESQRRFEEDERPEDLDRFHDPDYALNKKLDSAEFSVLYDAGPKDAAFHAGARLTDLEVLGLLQEEYIAPNSLFINTQTGRCHRVIRDSRGRLALDPPYEPIQSAGHFGSS